MIIDLLETGDGGRHLQIREELVGICEAAGIKQPARAAAVLHVMARWQEFKIKECAKRLLQKKSGSMWFYMPASQLVDECFGLWSEGTIRRTLADLVEAGWLVRQKNPLGWDNTYHYKLNAPAVNAALWAWYQASGWRSVRHGDGSTNHSEGSTDHGDGSTDHGDGTIPQRQNTETLNTETVTETNTTTVVVSQLISLKLEKDLANTLVSEYGVDRVREVVAASPGKQNPGGWVLSVLQNGWAVAKKQVPPWKRDGASHSQSVFEGADRYLSGPYADFLHT